MFRVLFLITFVYHGGFEALEVREGFQSGS